ncbi:MAG: PIN domain-containing protein [Candidatus Thermoplasmatota archaeon]|nr:PIN domain-containing protein [Candidatus Thermoplasmatota archaeon]MCL5789528.1 PIN domain-containing protein [Candidatus Thermoplasmatota archaeon]
MIILDTNALIYSIKQKIDLKKFLDEEIAVPLSAIRELETLSEKDRNAKLALQMSSRFRILEVESRGDRGIIEAASRYGGTVMTNDRELGKSLREMNVRVATISERKVRKP